MNHCILVNEIPEDSAAESVEFGLDWGNYFTGRYFSSTLDRLYPDVFFYKFSTQRISRFGGREAGDEFEKLRDGRSVCVLTMSSRSDHGSPVVLTPSGARLYLLAI